MIIIEKKFVFKLGFEPQISSCTHLRSVNEPLKHTYQLRIKSSSHTSTQNSQNIMHAFTILKRVDCELVSVSQWFNGRAPVHKTEDLRFKSQIRHNFSLSIYETWIYKNFNVNYI